MASIRTLGIALCAISFLAVPDAAAQRRDPALDWTNGVRPASDQRTAEAMREYTSCIARAMRQRSVALLNLPYPSAEASAAALSLASDGEVCLDMFRVRFQLSLLRGGLFEAFYRRDFPGDGGRRRRATLSPPAVDLASDDWRRQTNCVVARERPRSDALIRTYPGTDPERTALEPLMPAIRACAQETGVAIAELRLFRSTLAESLYLSRAGEPVQPANDGE